MYKYNCQTFSVMFLYTFEVYLRQYFISSYFTPCYISREILYYLIHHII